MKHLKQMRPFAGRAGEGNSWKKTVLEMRRDPFSEMSATPEDTVEGCLA